MKAGIEAYPAELRAEAVRRLREGASTRQVAKALEVSQAAVWRWSRIAGVGRRRGASVTNETSQKRGT
jgi:transposase-like protein